MRLVSILLLLLVLQTTWSQSDVEQRYGIWTNHGKTSRDIYGIALGGTANQNDSLPQVRTFGLRVEVPGVGVFSPLIPQSPIRWERANFTHFEPEYSNDLTNGILISSGTWNADVNGISIGAVGQYLRNGNGLSISGLGVIARRHNGVMISLSNESLVMNGVALAGIGNTTEIMNGLQLGLLNEVDYSGTGLQIGLWNRAKNFRGLQFGLWNVIDGKGFPLVNMKFKRQKQ